MRVIRLQRERNFDINRFVRLKMYWKISIDYYRINDKKKKKTEVERLFFAGFGDWPEKSYCIDNRVVYKFFGKKRINKNDIKKKKKQIFCFFFLNELSHSIRVRIR